MRVIILGPVLNEALSGGVGVFDEGLYYGFKSLGDDVQIISLAKSSSIDNIVIGKGNNNTNKIFFLFDKIAKAIRGFEPDLVISSVQYSIGIKRYRKKWPNAKYVQVLHGVAWPINGRFKAFAVNHVAKTSRKRFDYVATVSYLSYALNLQYNGIKCDSVIHNGVVDVLPSYNKERDIDFLYIGRLFPDKQIELLCDSFVYMLKKNPSLNIVVGGYGELSHLFEGGKYKNSGIKYVGKLQHSQVRNYFSRSKFFVSLHPTETFGTVFNEAILCGCNIISQSTTGVAGIYFDSDYFHVADCVNPLDLSKRLEFIRNHNYKNPDDAYINKLADYFSYSRVATDYKNLILKDE